MSEWARSWNYSPSAWAGYISARMQRIYTHRTNVAVSRTYLTDNPYWSHYSRYHGALRRKPACPRPKQVPQQVPDGKVLRVKSVDLQEELNRKQHRTKLYEKQGLIIRRGQRIELTVHYDRPFDSSTDDVVFLLEMGDDPRPSKGTMYSLRPEKDLLTPEKWQVRNMGKPDGKTEVKYRLMPAVDCAVGRWKLTLKTIDKSTNHSAEFDVKDGVIILFNPWCPADQCFMGKDEADSDDGSNWASDDDQTTDDDSSGSDNDPDDEDKGPSKRSPAWKKLREYILNQSGVVYQGSPTRMHGKAWNFGQFEDPCLDAALYILDISGIREGARANPTLVARKLSQMANSNNDEGILTGKWGGSYEGGTSPTVWNGSPAILEQYMNTKHEVKYGQCWVFSCLLTTLSRTLGIPARTVTNFSSAHDTDYSMTIDRHVGEDGEKLAQYDDSIWNFHVWNEAWFRRPDLPKGFDGWQAFDATPQELSEGVMQCGPAPLTAIKNGDVYVGYDTKFLYGEVNGDVITWLVNSDFNLTPQKVDKRSVGKNISTKCVGPPKMSRYSRYGARTVGDRSRKDITHLYKHKEGSEEERQANAKALEHSSRKKAFEDELPSAGDVKFTFKADESRNGDMTSRLHVSNTSNETRTVHVKVSVHAMYYTGQTGEELKTDQAVITLQPGGEKEHVTKICTSEYINKIDADAAVDFYSRARVQETGQRYVSDDISVKVDKPDLILTPSTTTPVLGEPFHVKVKFTNPLNVDMTNLSLRLESSGITKSLNVPLGHHGRRLSPGESLEVRVDLKARVKGKHEIIASLTSKQITDLSGACLVNVKRK